MTTESLQRLRDFVEVRDMAPNIPALRADVASLLAELEKLENEAQGLRDLVT